MRIETDPKLDFEDVLIRPKRSTLSSREEVNLDRIFTTKFSNKVMSGIPIIAANMDSIGTFDMAKSLSGEHIYTAIHKHYTIDQLSDFFINYAGLGIYVFYTLGSSSADLGKFVELNSILINTLGYSPIQNVCLDVANGYTRHFVDSVKKFREKFFDKTIMAGNIVTAEMAEELILAGADIAKVGIGPGCFIA